MADIMKDVHGAIERALEARLEHLTREANTLTLFKTRRLLEKDLNVEQGFLDPYKDFVKDRINKLMQGHKAESLKTQETEEVNGKHDKSEEHEVESSPKQKPKLNRLKKKTDSEDIEEEMMKDQGDDAGVSSMEEEEMRKLGNDSQVDSKDEVDMESLILEAARKRVSYFTSQAESLTLQGVRRLLEQDLKLEKGGLDAHKQHIRTVLDQLLNTEKEEPVAVTDAKKRKAAAPESAAKSNKSSKKQKAARSEEVEEDASSEEEESQHGANRKSMKAVKKEDEGASGDDDDDEESNEEDSSRAEESDDEETERKKVHKQQQPKKLESKPTYGRKVEQLKSIIKASGLTVPPSVYKRAKQTSEKTREAVLLNDLEAILRKEGLTASASKDEIKAVRKRKEKLKDLEGIDTSNIIVESRGRRAAASAINFFAPKRSDAVDLSDEDEEEEEEEESDSEGDPDVEPQDDDDDED